MNSGISDSDSGQNTKMAGLSQNQCPVYRGMTVRVMPESVSGLLRNMHMSDNVVFSVLSNHFFNYTKRYQPDIELFEIEDFLIEWLSR